MQVSRSEVIKRCTRGRCPNCGRPGLFGSKTKPAFWGFLLRKSCTFCQLRIQEEHGLTLGTTSIGYVIALFVVLLPAIAAALLGYLSVWQAVFWGIVGSFLLPTLAYPLLLRMVLASWFGLNFQNLPANQDPASAGEPPLSSTGEL